MSETYAPSAVPFIRITDSSSKKNSYHECWRHASAALALSGGASRQTSAISTRSPSVWYCRGTARYVESLMILLAATVSTAADPAAIGTTPPLSALYVGARGGP